MYIGMPNDPNASEGINAEALGKTLKAITNIYPLTIIDGGSELNDLHKGLRIYNDDSSCDRT